MQVLLSASFNGYLVEPPLQWRRPENRDLHLDLPAKHGREKVGTSRVQEVPVLSIPPFSGPVPHRKLPGAIGASAHRALSCRLSAPTLMVRQQPLQAPRAEPRS